MKILENGVLREMTAEEVEQYEQEIANAPDDTSSGGGGVGETSEFSLIQSTTVEEADIHEVEFTNLNLKGFYLIVKFPADTVKKIVGGRVYLKDGNYNLINLYTNEGISTTNKYLYVYGEMLNGYWKNVWKKSTSKNDMNGIASRSYVDHSELLTLAKAKHNVYRVVINAGDADTNVYFPVGTVIELNGVVAE